MSAAGDPGHVYVDLDSLLDTRLGTLRLHWPEVFAKCVADQNYYLRERDDFTPWGGPTQAEFAERYAQRDVETLQHSMVTAVPGLVKNMMEIQDRDFEETPYFSSIGLDINIWPYELQDGRGGKDELDEIAELRSIMRVYSGLHSDPNIISRPPESMTPAYITSRYKTLFMYDFRDWLSKQVGLRSMQMMRITFLSPWLLPAEGQLLTPEQLAEAGLRPEASHRLMVETALREFMDLEYLCPAFFSFIQEELVEKLLGIRRNAAKTETPKTA